MSSFFETIMLICFGLSWPMNLSKAYKARTTKGTSLPFILLIITGYVSGITAKILTGKINYVFVAYIINLVIVLLNVMVYFRNLAFDKAREDSEETENKSLTLKAINGSEVFKMNLDTNQINNYHNLNELTTGNGIVILGSQQDVDIPANELKQAFGIEENIYNRSLSGLKISDARVAFDICVSELNPESMLLHIGENDIENYVANSKLFVDDYKALINHIYEYVPKCRIGIISLNNPDSVKVLNDINSDLRLLALSNHCEFCDINNMLWTPKEAFELNNFVINTGFESSLNIKRPLYSIARMLFRYQRTNNAAITILKKDEPASNTHTA